MTDELNEYSLAKRNMIRATKLWYIAAPTWFLFSIFCAAMSDFASQKNEVFGKLLEITPFFLFAVVVMPLWAFSVFKMGGFFGPAHLRCSNCKTPAYVKNLRLDFKFEGPARDFRDICPGCGNDNRLD